MNKSIYQNWENETKIVLTETTHLYHPLKVLQNSSIFTRLWKEYKVRAYQGLPRHEVPKLEFHH